MQIHDIKQSAGIAGMREPKCQVTEARRTFGASWTTIVVSIKAILLARMGRWIVPCGILLCGAINSAVAGSATGTVIMVQADSTLGGVFVQLSISPTFIYEASCPVPASAFLPSTDPLYATFLGIMLSAQVSGTPITVSTAGCVSVPGSQQPRIFDIQLGTKLPGT